MKKRIVSAFLCGAMLLGLTVNAKASASEFVPPSGNPLEEPVMMRVTCYTDGGITSTGHKVRHGICAGNPEWYGYTAMIWAVNEDGVETFLGYYEILDTGAGIDTDGDGAGDSIQNGTSLDVWVANELEAREWQSYGDYFLVHIIEGVG